MGEKGYKTELLDQVNGLSEARIKVLADFAAFLREHEEWEATAEIIGNRHMTEQIKRSREAWAQGKREDFSSWTNC